MVSKKVPLKKQLGAAGSSVSSILNPGWALDYNIVYAKANFFSPALFT
jgi:hypothetical protein